MALPTDSVAPDAPTDSTAIDGVLGLGNDDQEIRKWIASMSPPGVPVYDTGWVDVTLRSGFTGQGGTLPQVRRIGKTVHWRWGVSGTGLTAGTNTAVADVPAGFRPAQSVYTQAVGQNATVFARFTAAPDGSVQLHPGATVASYYVVNVCWCVD